MNWTGPRELRAQLQRCWDRGELLAGMVSGAVGLSPAVDAQRTDIGTNGRTLRQRARLDR